MSLEFKSIEVRDYFSLSQATLKFSPGIYLIEGENRDLPNYDTLKNQEVSVSNGSGKTTLFSAPYQCLFNKNSKDNKATITSVGNIYTNKPYSISLNFSKDGKSYQVDNTRSNNKIFITENGKDITPKGTANQLVTIKNIIGFDFATFSSLTFLNQQSLANIIDLTNKDNIVYQFFDIERLNVLEKELKRRRKARLEDRAFLVSNLSVVNKHLSLVEGFTTVDIAALKEQEALYNTRLLELEAKTNSPKLKLLRTSLSKIEDSIMNHKITLGTIKGSADILKEQLDFLALGNCPTCKQAVPKNSDIDEGALEQLRVDYKKVQSSLEEDGFEKEGISGEIETQLESIQKEKSEVMQLLNPLKTKIILGTDNNLKYDAALGNIKELKSEKALLESEAPIIDTDLKVLDALLAVLKSGAVVNVYLKKYRLLFVKNFRELKKYTSFDINIVIEVDKGKMNYTFFDGEKEKSFLSLSAGERTRVSLMLLLATLKTIEQLTNITINYLVLDELLGVLDHEGISFLEKVLDDMRKEKSIYIITHHNEISKDYADGIIKVVRENNLSTIEE